MPTYVRGSSKSGLSRIWTLKCKVLMWIVMRVRGCCHPPSASPLISMIINVINIDTKKCVILPRSKHVNPLRNGNERVTLRDKSVQVLILNGLIILAYLGLILDVTWFKTDAQNVRRCRRVLSSIPRPLSPLRVCCQLLKQSRDDQMSGIVLCTLHRLLYTCYLSDRIKMNLHFIFKISTFFLIPVRVMTI